VDRVGLEKPEAFASTVREPQPTHAQAQARTATAAMRLRIWG